MPKIKRKPFSELSKEVRKRPGAAAEIDARKEVNAVFDDDIVPLGLVEKDRGSVFGRGP